MSAVKEAKAREAYRAKVKELRDNPATSEKIHEAAVAMCEVGGWAVGTWPEGMGLQVAANPQLAAGVGSQVVIAMHAALIAPEWGRAFVEKIHWLDEIKPDGIGEEEAGVSLDAAARRFIGHFPISIHHEADE